MTEEGAPPSKVRPDKPIPQNLEVILVVVVYVLAAVVALFNSTHGYELSIFAGQETWPALFIAAIQDVMLAACVTVLAHQLRNMWAWTGALCSISFLVWSGIVTSLPAFCLPEEKGCHVTEPNTPTRVVVALLPIVYAILLSGLALTVSHAKPATRKGAKSGERVPGKTRGTGTRPVPASSGTGRIPGYVNRADATEAETSPVPAPEAPAEPVPGTAAERILAHLDLHADATRAELVEALGISEETVKKALGKLRAAGSLIEGSRRHSYRRPPHVVAKAQ